MLRRLLVLLLVSLGACTTEPGEAAKGSHVTVTDGFRTRSGVVIAGKHMLLDFDLVETIDKTEVRIAGGKPEIFRVIKRDPAGKLAVLYDAMASLSVPSIHDSGILQKGASLTAVLWEGETPEVRTGKITGWRYHEGKAYIETDLHLPDAGKGSGVYDAEGGLIGLYAFRFTSKLNYILPIEYALSTPKAIGTGFTGAGASDEFKLHYVAGTKHPDPLVPPQDFDTIIFQYSFSRSALVGVLIILDNKDKPSHTQDVAYELRAKNADGEERSIGKGKIEAANRRWATSPEVQAARAEELKVSYGKDFVDDNFAPYDFGELRWRVPLAPHCKEIKDGDSFNLYLTLADGRKTEPLPFRDLHKVCAGTEMSQGDNWEQVWGMVPADSEATAAAPKSAAKSKKKKKKKKKRKKRR